MTLGTIIAYAAETTNPGEQVAIQDVVNTNGRDTVGGGEILDFFNNSARQTWETLNGDLINQIGALPLIKIGICILLLLILILIVFRILGLGNGLVYSGVDAEIANINNLRKLDAYIIKRNKQLSFITKFIENLGLGVDRSRISYLEYNLKRAGLKNPGGQRVLTPQEYNAIIKSLILVFVCFGLLISLFNMTIGIIVIILGVSFMSFVPDTILRDIVVRKDAVIRRNFFDFYGELHYPIVGNDGTPLVKILRNYSKVDLLPEMQEFTNDVADIFDLHGEYEGTKYVAQEYKEIPEVSKLMRLIRQYHDGADVVNDMMGFREQLLLQQQMQIDKFCDKIIRRARSSFYLIYIILFQAIISAMAIYLPDLGNIGSLFG